MIDLMNNGNNEKIPPPVSTDPIVAMLNDMAIYDEEPPLLTLSMLISEVKMWRAKDEYDKKAKLVLNAAVIKKLHESGFEVE